VEPAIGTDHGVADIASWHEVVIVESTLEMRTPGGADGGTVQRPGVSRTAVRVARIELVGLAGVGKSHLARRLATWFGAQAVEHVTISPSWRDLPALPRVIGDLAPLLGLVLRSGGASPAARVRYCRGLIVHAWRDAAVVRSLPGRRVVIVEEGWFHKLRQLRRVTRTNTTFADLPERVGRRHFKADLVVLLTADATEICARKLRRRGRPVTPETLAQQYVESGALGQWDEYAKTRLDLEQAAASHQQRFVEIDYGDGFDLERDLVPHLRWLDLA
jgi:hypothetical protein